MLDGTDIWALAETELASFRCRDIGFIFQFPSLLSNLTAVDNVARSRRCSAAPCDAQLRTRAPAISSPVVGLADRADAYPDSMSGGEQRRAVVARALINSPRLLLADEPTSDLDEDTEADIIDLLEQLQRTEYFGLTLVTHNLELAKRRSAPTRCGKARWCLRRRRPAGHRGCPGTSSRAFGRDVEPTSSAGMTLER